MSQFYAPHFSLNRLNFSLICFLGFMDSNFGLVVGHPLLTLVAYLHLQFLLLGLQSHLFQFRTIDSRPLVVDQSDFILLDSFMTFQSHRRHLLSSLAAFKYLSI